MQLKVTKVPISENEVVEIKCHKIGNEVSEIISFVKFRQGVIKGKKDGNVKEIPMWDLYYIESVDNRTYIYTINDCYEAGMRIYELEEMLSNSTFVRIQKGMILNLMKVNSIKPGLSGRYVALLKNNEEVIISRKYVPDFKQMLKGGARNEIEKQSTESV